MRLAPGAATPASRHGFIPSRSKQASSFIIPMEAFLVSAGVVALSEIGDKTQLLALVADKLDDDAEPPPMSRWGVFGLTLVAFFLAEMGDKTQIATVVLAAQFHSLLAVVLGTTCGMLVADVAVVLIGKAASTKVPFKAARIVAALLFAGLGVYALLAPAME